MKRGGKSRVVRKPTEVSTSLLDAYTESQPTSTMSDSDKFKEGYVKKKDKGKQKRTSKKSETEEDHEQEVKEEEVEMKESWEEEEVIESWETLEVEEMPLPQKVKQVLRKEEKKRKKEERKAEKEKSDEPPVITEKEANAEEDEKSDKADTLADNIKEMSLKDKPEGKKAEYSEDEKADIKAEREAKKAAKTMKAIKSTSKDVNKEATGNIKDPESKTGGLNAVPTVTEGEKTKAELKAERKAQFELQQKLKGSADPAEKPGEKSKAELKAERRAKQEAQRKAKTESQDKKTPEQKPGAEEKKSEKKAEKKSEKKTTSVACAGKAHRQVGLFSHLHQYERNSGESNKVAAVGGDIHPAFIQLGLQHADRQVVGSSGRATSLLLALKALLLDSLPVLSSSAELYKEVESLIATNLTFLRECRKMSISMLNALKYVQREIRQIESNLSAEELKTNIEEIIDDFININFTLHPKAISETANKKIRHGDVILTYSYSKLVEKALLDAAEAGKKIKVIVADGRLESLGRRLCSELVSAGLHTTYILISAVSSVLPSVTKVVLGCDGVMANGCVLATVGTSQVALLAKSCNKPVIFCSETYKFTERVQTDSFVFNELLDPEDLVSTGGEDKQLADWRDQSSLCLLNLVYDLTPASLVDSIVTEISEIPPTSVPVVLRLHSQQT